MDSKKKDLEIIYSLQWKNMSANGSDKANIIGMYDIPATTLNWEIFKSYLLKHSGTVGDDVKVYYITDRNREFPIESQTDFQIALYAFRRKARMGDVVNLKLDRISDQPTHRNIRHSNDVQTQYDNEAPSLVSTCCNADSPPEWFISYMTQFKKDFSEELTSTVSAIVSNMKPIAVSQPVCHHTRKTKVESSKRIRKLPHPVVDFSNDTKEIMKSLKLEGKLERKLEKLECKTKKIREKKLALFTKSSDSEAGPSNSRARPDPPQEIEHEDELLPMDARPINFQQSIPRFYGGGMYTQQWYVENTGQLPWNANTSLVYTWGSKDLEPEERSVAVPHLKPGEKGVITVVLHIPRQPGHYECYWHFHQNSRRFGHWLGCQITVEEKSYDLENYTFSRLSELNQKLTTPKETVSKVEPAISETFTKEGLEGAGCYEVVRNIGSRVADMKLQDPTDTNCSSSDSDNQSIVSVPESRSSKGLTQDYIVVPIPECFKIDDLNAEGLSSRSKATTVVVDSAEKLDIDEKNSENFDGNNNSQESDQNSRESLYKVDDASSNSSRKSDIVMVTLPEKNEDTEECALVMVDGVRVSIPKKIIKAEYLQTVEQKDKSSTENSGANSVCHDSGIPTVNPNSPVTSILDLPLNAEANNDMNSHCSAAGSCFSDVNNATDKNDRFFVFPEDCPGFEVLYPNLNSIGEMTEHELLGADRGIKPELSSEGTERHQTVIIPQIQPITVAPPLNLSTHDRNPFECAALNQIPVEDVPPQNEIPREVLPEANVAENPRASEAHFTPESMRSRDEVHTIHILPETLVSGAVNVASTAFHTARSVINRIVPQEQPGQWINGHWVSSNPTTPREANLHALAEMGFWNRDLNATLLARYNDDLSRVVAELVQ
ncbi:uncharacterized protein isoform X2 [Leptinotarsa decemlineata]|uniref:uncharacterized protein isoform X2 n=1 Tax=Leptinotarsa decemlineata TaxID=7539 RepID=UPI003D306AA2